MAVEQAQTYTLPRLAPGLLFPQLHLTPFKMQQPSYAYPPAQSQSGEQQRQSPSSPHSSLPPRSLPPLRSIEGQYSVGLTGQTSPPHLLPHGCQHGPQSMSSMHGYYGQAQHALPGMPWTANARYALIPPGQAMTGGRGKKEIKRRTKTGCLTCRKRRIKCDEQHPTCRNCEKSKRECLGYDPIFKQQSGPPALQPAPAAATTSTASASPTPSSATSGGTPYSPARTSYQPSQPHTTSYPHFPETTESPTQSSSGQLALSTSPHHDRKQFDLSSRSLPPPPSMDSPKTKPGTDEQ